MLLTLFMAAEISAHAHIISLRFGSLMVVVMVVVVTLLGLYMVMMVIQIFMELVVWRCQLGS